MLLAEFAKIAPHLSHPLVLVGFVMLLAYGIHWQLMKSGLLRQVTQKDSGLIIRLFLRYGFWLALTLLVAGFGLAGWSKYVDKVQPVDAGKLAAKLVEPLQGELAEKNEQIKALTEAIRALSKTDAPAASLNEALQALKMRDTAKAQAIFAEIAATKEAAGKKSSQEAAEAYRHLGALAFMDDIKAALTAYQKAVELEPDNAKSWIKLGHLFVRTGKLDQAEEVYRKVLVLGEVHQNKEEQADAYGSLGFIYAIYGELDKVEEMHRKVDELAKSDTSR